MSDLIDREQAKDAIDKYLVGRNLVTDGTMMARLINEIVIDRLPSAQPTFDARDTQYNLPIGTDLISRQALLDKFEPWLKVKDYNDGELNMLKAILYEIRFMPSAKPYTIHSDGRLWVTVDDIDKVTAVVVDEHKSKFCKQFYEDYEDAQPEITYCKDCKHYWIHKCMDSMPMEICDLEQTFYDAEHDFCSLAERREVTNGN